MHGHTSSCMGHYCMSVLILVIINKGCIKGVHICTIYGYSAEHGDLFTVLFMVRSYQYAYSQHNGPYSLFVCASYFILCSVHTRFTSVTFIDCKWHWGCRHF